MRLKDGSVVGDARLDRLAEFDERSRRWPVRALVRGKEPRSYTWRCGTWLDQGQEGACVGFGFGHELAARPAEVKGMTNDAARQLYWRAQRLDEWPGGSYPGAEPEYEGTSVLAGAKAVVEAGWAKGYRWAFSAMEVVLGIGYNGPAVLGLPWYEGMCEPDGDGFIWKRGKVVGGHCILARGVRLRMRGKGIAVLLRNSWGRGWGKDGDCWVWLDVLHDLLMEEGEACFLEGRVSRLAPMAERRI